MSSGQTSMLLPLPPCHALPVLWRDSGSLWGCWPSIRVLWKYCIERGGECISSFTSSTVLYSPAVTKLASGNVIWNKNSSGIRGEAVLPPRPSRANCNLAYSSKHWVRGWWGSCYPLFWGTGESVWNLHVKGRGKHFSSNSLCSFIKWICSICQYLQTNHMIESLL